MTVADVSEFQGDIDWHTAAPSLAGAWVKAYQNHIDPKFAQNWAGTKAAGVPRGAYCWGNPNVDPVSQAQAFLGVLGPDTGELRCVLDAEEAGLTANWCLAWLTYVQAKVGYPPVLYTGASFLRTALGADPRLKAFPLWVAAYGPNDGQLHTIFPAPPWQPAAHQYTSVGSVPGIGGHVDLSVILDPAGVFVNQTPPVIPPPVSVEFPEEHVIQTDISMKLDASGNGHVPLPMKASVVHSAFPIATRDPAVAHGYDSIPRVALTIGTDGNAEIVVEGGIPNGPASVRFTHE